MVLGWSALLLLLSWVGLEDRLQEPLDPGIWELVEDPTRGISDAIFVHKVMKVHETRNEYFIQCRILSEIGKQVPMTLDFSEGLSRLEGRVIDRSGKIHPFSGDTHLVEQLALAYGDRKETRKVLLPPGLTSDCVLEVFWEEATEKGLPSGQNAMFYPIPGPFFCSRNDIYVWNAFDKFSKLVYTDSIFALITRFYATEIGPPAKLDRHIAGDFTVISYRDVPPIKDFPFGAPHFDHRMAYFNVFKTIPVEEASLEEFWDLFAQLFVQYFFDQEHTTSSDYREWIAFLRSEMPEHGPKGAVFVHDQFKKRIQSLDLLQADRRQTLPLRLSPLVPDNSSFLQIAFHRGCAIPVNLSYLLFRVMRDCGFPVNLLFTTHPSSPPFKPEQLNPFSLDLENPFLLIRTTSGSMCTYAPSFPEMPSGYLPPGYRGGMGLVVDPDRGWTHQIVELPKLSWSHHKFVRTYKTRLAPDGLVRFVMTAQGTGQFDAPLRRQFFGLPEEEQGQVLTQTWQNRLPHWTIGPTRVQHAADPGQSICLAVQGQRRLPRGPDWTSLPVFPGAELPLKSPNVWPKDRTQPVLLPHNFGLRDKAVIDIPAGWQALEFPSFSRSNQVGKVALYAQSEGRTVTVVREIVVKDWLLRAPDEPLVKEFLNWLQATDRKNLAVSPR